ncbi:hypothetical protein CC2G_002199 [Coprinopsis cinerea AmutBmut pab1-1]|nr:hypothetical protein CC2G_002199 [Coprinopsis cinerea AmutBmut pab1-1]
MSSASVNAPQVPQTLTSSLRNLEKFINSRPSTWSKDRKDDKVLFIAASYALIDLLSKDPKFEEYRKKEYIGDAVFLWLKYLAKRRQLQESPETVNLGRFNHEVFSVPIQIPLLSGKPYTPHPSLSRSKERSPSAAPAKPPAVIAKNTSTQSTKNPGAPSRSRGHENDEETSGKESTKVAASKKAPKGGVGKGKRTHSPETVDDDAMDVDGEETSQKRTKKLTNAREDDEGLSWNAKDDSDDSYQGSDDEDDETDSDSAKKIKKDIAKKKPTTSKTSSVPVKRNRADADSAPGAAKRSKSSVPDGYYEARTPCTTCLSKRQSCFINKPRVACIGCKPPGQKRIATCNFSSRRRKGQGDDGGKDCAEDASTVNDEDIEDNVEEGATSAPAIVAKRPRQVSEQDAESTGAKQSATASPQDTLDILVQDIRDRKRGSADAKGQQGGEKAASPSAASAIGDGISAKTSLSTKSTRQDKGGNLSRVAPAAPVELPLSTVDRTVTRLLMENARQQSSINYLTATLEVLLEDAKEYEKVLAKSALQETRISNLEAQVEAAEKEIKRMHEERDADAKTHSALNKGNTERIQWLASTVTVINNWVASKMKVELGGAFVPPTDTNINGIQIPMPLVTTPTPSQSTPATPPSPSSTAIASNPPAQNGHDSANQGGLLQFIKFPEDGPLGDAANGHTSTFLNTNGLQETEEVERLMRED